MRKASGYVCDITKCMELGHTDVKLFVELSGYVASLFTIQFTMNIFDISRCDFFKPSCTLVIDSNSGTICYVHNNKN